MMFVKTGVLCIFMKHFTFSYWFGTRDWEQFCGAVSEILISFLGSVSHPMPPVLCPHCIQA
jgi:hypothetical protein